jgi:two-component system, chemotaxis family, chemotaxis protein CheY
MSEFRDIRTLIIDPAGHSKALLKSLLTTLEVARVVTVTSTEEALLTLRREVFSVVFCDELAGPLDPVAFLKTLRRDLATRDVTVPVVLVSAGADYSKIIAARDAGINDIMAKPVSAETVERKLRSLLLAPRSFVTAKAFVGPDRRRSGEDRRPFGERRPGGEDRRGKSADGSVFAIGPRLSPDEPTRS